MNVEFNEGNFDRRPGGSPTGRGLTGWVMKVTGASETAANGFLIILSLAVILVALIILVSSL